MMYRTYTYCTLTLCIAIAGTAIGCGPPGDDNMDTASCANPQTLNEVEGGETIEAGCYRAPDGLGVDEGTLTLEPGVTIRFAQNTGLTAANDSGLKAEGTSDAPILLTGVEKQPGFWKGVKVDTASNDNAFDHVTVEYAGSGTFPTGQTTTAGLLVDTDGTMSVSNSTFRDNAGAGLLTEGEESETTIDSSTFENNDLPLHLHANQVRGLGADNSFSDNGESYVKIGVQSGRDLVKEDAEWVAPGIPYRADRRVIANDTSLTVSPGTTLTFSEGTGLILKKGGTLTADASDGDRITFTAGDGEEINGYWQGIRFNETKSGDNVFKNATVEYAGSGNWNAIGDTQSNINLQDSQITLQNAEIAGSGGPGLAIDSDSTVQPCTDVTFRDNTGRDVAGDGMADCSSN